MVAGRLIKAGSGFTAGMIFSMVRGVSRRLAVNDGKGRYFFLALACLFIVVGAVENARQDHRIERRFSAAPLTFTVITDDQMSRGEVLRQIQPEFLTPKGPSFQFAEHDQLRNERWFWHFTELAEGIRLDTAPGYEDRIAAVELTVGGEAIPVHLSRPESIVKKGRTMLRHEVVLPDQAIRHSWLAPGTGLINWPGDGVMLERVFSFVALWGGILGLVLFVALAPSMAPLRERHLARLTDVPQSDHRSRPIDERLWFWGGFSVVLGTLAALQWQDPFYFSQDDNFSQFLPVMLAGGQSFFEGMLFDYNPYQLLGAPTVEVGTYALTYPGTYLSYALARLLGNENLTLEIFAMGHLAAGFAATWWAARRWGAGAAMAAALGVCFVLSGYALVAGRSWYYMTPVFLWLPVAVATLHGVFFRERKVADTVLLALSVGLLFHAGNAQMWVYTAGLVTILALLLCFREGWPRRAFVHLSAAGVGALAIAMPLLLLQFGFATQAIRTGGDGYTVGHSLTSLLLPFPLDFTDMNFGLSPSFLMDMGPFLFAGPLLVPAGLLVAAGLFAAWFGRTTGGRPLPVHALFAFAGTAVFLLAFGHGGPLWFLHASLPVLEKFTHPVKLLPLAVLLLGLAAVLAWERLRLPDRLRQRVAAGFALCAFGFMFWNAMRTDQLAFHYFAEDPYPGVERAMTEPREHRARIYPMSPERSTHPGFTASRNLNFAMLHGTLSLWGYDPIIWTHPHFQQTLIKLVRDPVPLLQEFGVDRLLVWQEVRTVPAEKRYIDVLKPWQADVAGLIKADGVGVPELAGDRHLRGEVPVPGAKPLAWVKGNTGSSFPVTVSGPRVSIAFGEAGWPGGELVLSFLAYGRTTVTADGQPVDFYADDFGRVVANVPKGARKVMLGYNIQWLPGLSVAFALLGVAVYVIWRFGRQGQRKNGL